jgi:hypothetical protein
MAAHVTAKQSCAAIPLEFWVSQTPGFLAQCILLGSAFAVQLIQRSWISKNYRRVIHPFSLFSPFSATVAELAHIHSQQVSTYEVTSHHRQQDYSCV